MRKVHYAWVVCAASTLVMICNMGLCSTLLSAYLPYIEGNGISDSAGSLIVSVRSLFSLFTMFFVSRYYSKFSLRTGIALATALGGVAMVVFSVGGSVPVYYAAAGIAGIAFGLGTTIPTSMLLSRWFSRRRGMALGICASGSGIATICFPTIIELLVSHFGLRVMFWCVAGFMLLSAVMVWLLIRSAPEERGLTAYDQGAAQERTRPVRSGSYLPGMGWVLLTPVMVLEGSCSISGSSHLSVLMNSSGYPSETAAVFLSLFGLCLTFGKFAFGAVADRIGAKWATTIAFSLLTVGLLTPLCMDGQALWPCAVTVLLLGVGYPPTTVGISLSAADFSTPETYEKTLKRMQITATTGGILMGAMPGSYYDIFGSYQGAYVILALGVAVSVPLLWLVYRARRPAAAAK